MKKITYILVIITMMLFLGSGILPKVFTSDIIADKNIENRVNLNIMTITKAQYYMVKSIVGDKHNVEFLVENEDQIDDFEINDELIKKVSKKDLLITTGFDQESCINKLISKVDRNNVAVVDMSRGIKAIPYELNLKGNNNPHYTLNLDSYKVALYNIKSSIQDRDIENRDEYEENYNNSVKAINISLKEKNISVESLAELQIITDTDAFDYFFAWLGLDVIKVTSIEDVKKIDALKKKDNTQKAEVTDIAKKTIFVKDKNSSSKLENSTIEEKIPVVQLCRYGEDKSYLDIILYNVNAILEEMKKNN